jgi:hypothetical protein
MITVEHIEAVGKIVVPLGLGWLGYLQMRCRQDLNIAHAKLRAKDSGKPWQEELRTNYRLFRSRKHREEDHAGNHDQADNEAGE